MKRLALVAALAACVRTPRTMPSSTAQVHAVRPATTAHTSEVLVARFRELESQLPREQVRYDGVIASGFITHAAAVTTPIEVPENRCVSIIALGSMGLRDLDARLFDPSGDLVVEDVETDAHPTVQLCTTTARRVYHHLEAYDGVGAYAVGVFVTDREGLTHVARAIGGRPGVAVGTGGERSEIERRMNELRDGIARRGFQPVGDPTRTDFAATGAVRVPLAVTPDRCYTVAAVADGAVRDTDLVVYDAQGEMIARDQRASRDATVQLCPPVPTTVAIEVRATSAAGGGTVVLQAFAADAASLGGASALWLGERTTSGARAEALDHAVPQVLRTLATMGFTPIPEAPRPAETLGAGEYRERELRAESGRCTLVAAIAGRGLGGLRIELFNRDGDLLARGTQHGSAAVAAVCPTSAEPLRAVVSARTGTGALLLRTLQNTTAPAWSADIDRIAVSETLADAWARADAGWQADGTPEKLRVGAGARRVREVNRAAGECVRYTASAGRGLPWVSLALRTASGDRVAATTGEGTAVITRCGDTAERLQLELRTDPSTLPEVDAVLSRAVRPDTRSSDAH